MKLRITSLCLLLVPVLAFCSGCEEKEVENAKGDGPGSCRGS